MDGVKERKKALTFMLEESRFWDMQKSELEYWLNSTLQNVAGKKVSECTIQELTRELNNIDSLVCAIESYKAKMTELNFSSSKLIEKYVEDDTTTISQETSSLNNKWTKLSDNVRVRRAVLEASLRGRNDFQTAFDEFDAWLSKVEELSDLLDRETTNSQLIKDAAYRKNWMEKEKDYRAELEAHGDIFDSLQENGRHLIENLDEKGQDRSKMVDRLKNIDERWVELRRKLDGARQRLEAAQEQWERLTGQLNDLSTWVEEKSEKILQQRDAGGDLTHVKRQISFCQTLREEIDQKAPIFEETNKLARSFLIQQDIRSLETAVSRMPSDESKLTEDEITKKISLRIAQRVKLEVDLLTEKWPEFLDHAHRWERIVDNAFMKMSQFDQTLKACDQELSKAELQRKQWKAVKDVKLEDLPNQMETTRNFRLDISTSLRRAVDDVNDGSAQLLANDIHVSPELTKLAESLNIRFKQLESTVEQRLSALESALRDFGPSSQHFLECKVAENS
uniref:Dystrophin n=1 Tax=Romanomermis culicivorax TaxID=13658 RepID=A0A915HIP2_ROMCU